MMETNRLSSEMEELLSKQMTQEAYSAQIYLALGIWADDKGYGGISNFLFRHAYEERNHMTKFMQYILDRGGKPVVEAIPAPKEIPTTLSECFELVLKQEIDNTEKVYDIVNLSSELKDWATWNFAQWFVKEQIEEEKMALNLIDKLKIAGGDRATDESLFNLDKTIGKTPSDFPIATQATEDKPA